MSTFGKVGARGILMKPPYDAEVEYLESTGTQYIDTGTPYSRTIDLQMSMMPRSFSNGYVFGVFYAPTNSASIRRWCVNCIRSSTALDPQFGTYLSDRNIVINPSGVTDISCNATALTANGVSITASGQEFDTSVDVSVYLFCRHTYAPQLAPSQDAIAFLAMRCYSCQIRVSGTIVRDYAPVRVGSGSSAVGYLYDRANPDGGPIGNGLYGNAGTGAFVIGPDKP